jgi:uncharacterized protein
MLAVITGASAGIGASFARKLAARGYDLLLVARRTDRLESLARDLRDSSKVQVEVFGADLADALALESVAARIESATNLGLLINNAGFGTNGYFWEAEITPQQQMLRLHVVAAGRLTHAAVGNLVRQAKPGTGVINVSSVAAFGGAPQNVNYCSTKAWMNSFTAALSVELAGRRSPVKVQALCPGFTLSEFHDVLGMDRSGIPSWLWLTADFVTEESLKAFAKGKLMVVPGWRYKVLTGFMRVLPGAVIRRISATGVRRYRRSKAGSLK